VEVTEAALDPQRLAELVRRDEAGAVLVFQGVARNNSEGRQVVALEYDAYPKMAVRKLREVAQDVRARWPVTGIAVQHRTGRLAIGEASLLVAVSSAHRAEAFEACLYAVDRIKQTVPIWKKEIWQDGDGAWVAGHTVDVAEPPR
jgi:molybdopterin synthase catalytic subunit